MSVTFDPSNDLSGINVAIEVEWGGERKEGEEPEERRARTRGIYMFEADGGT